MITSENLLIYAAIRNAKDRSSIEDNLVLDGFDVSTFSSASDLWTAFQVKQARFIISDRRFGAGLNGVDLARNIRKAYTLPYIYIVVLSVQKNLKDIKEALNAGVDDYLVKPHNPLQLRSRILIGLRWINYIDSLFHGQSK